MKRISYILIFCLSISLSTFAQDKEAPKAKAKSIIYLFLNGGPSQTDTFDPKIEAGRNIYGNYPTVIDTNNDSLKVNKHLKNLAKIADKYSIIRSMTIASNAHEIGQYLMYSAAPPKASVVYPSFGAVLTYLNPMNYNGKLPPYICATKAATRFNEGGFLGADYKPFSTGGVPESSFFEVEGVINRQINDGALTFRKNLLATIDKSVPEEIEQCGEVQKFHAFRENNFDLILGDSRKVFDLKSESAEVRKKYGMNRFGQSCLLARRLVQSGTPIVVVNYTGWDTHKEHFKRMDQRLGTLDMGLSALINDLDECGLLDSTIVMCGGEFGRTPRVMYEPPWNGGRGHFGAAFSYLVAGGGFKGGVVVGRTDKTGENVIERPVRPADLIGTVYKLMGVDPYGTIPHPLLGEIPLLPALKDTTATDGIVTELIK